MNQKEHVIVVLGAGASAHAHVPMTPKLTQTIAKYELKGVDKGRILWINDPAMGQPYFVPADPWDLKAIADCRGCTPPNFTDATPVFRTIFDTLEKKFEAPNFEYMLAALEDLQAVSQSQSHSMKDKFRNVLAPFVKIEVADPILRQPTFLWIARTAFIMLISRILQDQIAKQSSPEQQTKEFFASLREHYHVSIFTLNYDDLPELAGLNLHDGFTNAQENFSVFDRTDFLHATENNVELLCHLHGSIRFGYPRGVPELFPKHKIAKYESSAKALDSMKGVGRNETNVNGHLVSSYPLISGSNKVAKLVYSPMPYGYYYRAFSERLMKCSRLVIIGYGGFDDHVNTWLREFMSIHKQNKRVVYVTPRTGKEIGGEVSASERLMLEFATPTDFIRNTNACYDEQHPNEFGTYGNLAFCAAGFPFKQSNTMNKVIKFLDSHESCAA